MAKETDDLILAEAFARFKEIEERESKNRTLWLEDLKFSNGDADNNYQWESDVSDNRLGEGKPCLTVNKIKVHNRAIANDYRQNRSSPKVLPVGNGANKETAQVFNGLIKHIEQQSSADNAYSLAFDFAVDAGLGYYRIVTDYIHEGSFDQEIYIRRITNPLNVYTDKPKYYADGRDIKYAFIIEQLTTEEFEATYPDKAVSSFTQGDSWGDTDNIRVAEYFRVLEVQDTLYALPNGNTILKSKLKGEDVTGLKSRDVTTQKVEWFKIGNNEILERGDWLGKYIPLVRVVGYELEIENEVHRCGHTRALKDTQRMYNYWSSSSLEYASLAGKQPYLAPFEAINGFESEWDNMNTSNAPYLPFNSVDAQGNQIPMPRKQEPPQIAQAYLEGMRVASDELQAISGQYDAQMGQNVNNQSGVALNALQRKGDNATYHFVDNAELAKVFTATLLIDLIPKVYDTPRVVKIIGEDDTESDVQLDPTAPNALNQVQDINGEIQSIYNPSVGIYDVVASSGANYATKRQEQSAGMLAMVQANPQIWGTAGDLIVKSQDWEMSDEIADRLKRSIDPSLLGESKDPDAIPPDVQEHMDAQDKMIQAMDKTIEELTLKMQTKDLENEIAVKKVTIEEYKALTDRMKVTEGSMSQEAIQAIVTQTVQNVLSNPISEPQVVDNTLQQ